MKNSGAGKKLTPVIIGLLVFLGIASFGSDFDEQKTSTQNETYVEDSQYESSAKTQSDETSKKAQIDKNHNLSSERISNDETIELSENPSGTFDYFSLLEYTSSPYVEVNGNVPYFSTDELTTESFESYGELDSLGRCTTAYACIGTDLFPTEERGKIGGIKPTGWHTVKYDGIDGNFLYNRCHLIMYAMTGENANEKNLITGTRYMNTQGMLPFEEKTHDYIEATGNHVMYRVTPVFVDNELLTRGVLMEAYSVEDDGAGICFCVFCYNVQPGVTISYDTGDSSGPEFLGSNQNNASNSSDQTNSVNATNENTITSTDSTAQPTEAAYIGNKNTGKYHRASCSSVGDMNEENKVFFQSKDEAEAAGYQACKRCHP